MATDPTSNIPPGITEAILGIIGGLLAKLGWDKRKKSQREQELESSDPNLTLDSRITPNQSVLLYLSNRVHALRDELSPKFNVVNTDILKLDLRMSQVEKDLLEMGARIDKALVEMNNHIDDRYDRIETKQDKIEAKLDIFFRNFYEDRDRRQNPRN